MNGWTAENDEGTSSSFVSGPVTAPLGVGSFQANLGSVPDDGAGVVLYTNAYSGLSLSDVTGLSFDTYESSASNGESFDIVLGLSNGDALFFEPRYQGSSDTVTLGDWQYWTAVAGSWYSQFGFNGTLAGYEDANPGVELASIGVQAGYLNPLWTGFVGNVDGFSIQSSTGINDTYNFDPAVVTPEPTTWLSLGAGLLLVAGIAFSRRSTRRSLAV